MQKATMLNSVKPMVSTYKNLPIRNVLKNLPNPQIPPLDSVIITLSTKKIVGLIVGGCISIGGTIFTTICGGLYVLDKKFDDLDTNLNLKLTAILL
jgi:hypothetical protein